VGRSERLARPRRLSKLSERTRDLLEDLEQTRADVLSPADLNRALRQVLRNQVAILESLAGGGEPGAGLGASDASPRIRVGPGRTPHNGAGAPVARPAGLGSRDEDDDDEHEDPILELTEEEYEEVASVDLVGEGLARVAGGAKPPAGEAAADEVEERIAAGATRAEALLAEKRIVPTYLARIFVEQFDNRDKDFDKGLNKLNKWLAAGASGTPFQWRGNRAYLNLNGGGAATVKNYEEQLMTRMGFSRRLGRLEVPGLEGEVVVYERPN